MALGSDDTIANWTVSELAKFIGQMVLVDPPSLPASLSLDSAAVLGDLEVGGEIRSSDADVGGLISFDEAQVDARAEGNDNDQHGKIRWVDAANETGVVGSVVAEVIGYTYGDNRGNPGVDVRALIDTVPVEANLSIYNPTTDDRTVNIDMYDPTTDQIASSGGAVQRQILLEVRSDDEATRWSRMLLDSLGRSNYVQLMVNERVRLEVAAVSVDVASTAANNGGSQSITISGLTPGDYCFWVGSDTATNGMRYHTDPLVATTDTVVLHRFNADSVTLDPAVATHYFLILHIG